jgi:NAD-dependent deacetylase
MSVESGIPDFRSPRGLWRTYPPEDYATLTAFRADPAKVWRMLHAMGALLSAAEPNPGHHALARLQQDGSIRRVITQNIDGLHRQAGSVDPIEVHGSSHGLHCPRCALRNERATHPEGGVPRCPRCDGPMKPPVVLFEEDLPSGVMGEATRLANACDVMLVVGTSLAVYPVASLPDIAADAGATLVEINLEPVHLRRFGAIPLRGGSAQVLPQLAEASRALRQRA